MWSQYMFSYMLTYIVLDINIYGDNNLVRR